MLDIFFARTLITAAAAAGLLAGAAPAKALTILFSGSGSVSGPPQSPPVFAGLQVTPADSAYSFDAASGWTLASSFGGMVTATGGFSGAGSGSFAKGADSLNFNFTSQTAQLGTPLALSYTVTGGSGAYTGFTGSGTSLLILQGNPLAGLPVPFIEQSGVLNVTAVPEPASVWLWMLGMGMGMVAWRLASWRTASEAASSERTAPAAQSS